MNNKILDFAFYYVVGKGTIKITSCKKAGAIFVAHYVTNKSVTVMLAGSIALSTHFYDADKNTRKHNITCYPETANSFKNKFKSIKFDAPVVYGEINSYHLISSQGLATSIEFVCKLLSH
ncbi:unnamed protein product [Rotaria sp. Silwood2]|nr:unnamed protein product [Rotaria sp. Silwood2]CAF4161452.1 unnamed protein product [Rotaria sp. Silwood2]CAF4282885.1 unnamed protein product [Rotaria sp. Silwood2]